MFGNARAKDWYAALNAFARVYNISNPVSEPPRMAETRETWEQFLCSYKNLPANFGVEPHKVYSFVHSYTGNVFSNIHLTLILLAPISDEDAIKLKEIKEAHKIGKDAAMRDKISPELETITKQ